MSIPDGTEIILRATVGSTIHGTSVAQQDDRDEMAIGIEPAAYVVGLREWETTVERTQPEGVRSGPGDLDLVVHSLRKFCRLAARGNPTILLPLFVPSHGILRIAPLGQALRDQRSMFLSKHVGKAFLGYMVAQKERLMGQRGQMRVTRSELIDAYGFDTKYAGHIIRLGFQGVEIMTTGFLTLPMIEEHRQAVVDIRTGKWSLDRVLAFGGRLERELRDSLDETPLPNEPDTAAIDKFLVEAYDWVWHRAAQVELENER